VFAGFGLLYIAGGANGLAWGIEWQDAIVGLIALPVLMVAFGLAARRYVRGPVDFTGHPGSPSTWRFTRSTRWRRSCGAGTRRPAP
jgi:hypothetical protein